MKKRKSSVQMIAIVLSILMILNIPLPVLAQASIENAIEEQQNQPVLLTDRLTETETYWQNADGSITYEQHMEPIRYQDENGVWHEIENDVVQIDKSAESTDPFKNEGYAYRSESSKNWVLLDENIRSNQPIKLQFGQYGIASRPMWGNLPVQGEAMEDAATEGELQPTQTAVPQETLEKTKGEVEEQPASSPTREMEEEIECRISFIEKQKEKEEGDSAPPYTGGKYRCRNGSIYIFRRKGICGSGIQQCIW